MFMHTGYNLHTDKFKTGEKNRIQHGLIGLLSYEFNAT